MSQIYTSDTNRPLRGIFKMRVLDKAGRVVGVYEDHNMIVNSARTAMTYLVSEGLQAKVIKKFGVGTGTATATPSDSELTNPYVNNIINHSFPDFGVVKFLWRLGYDEANNMNVTEFGLYCADDTLFSRKVRSAIYKASDIAFEGEWSIIF